MSGFTVPDVARMLGLSATQVRSLARLGLASPTRGPRNRYEFSFKDLVLLRAAHDLVAARIPKRRIRAALAELQAELPDGRALSGIHIVAEGDQVVVYDGEKRWSPASGQLHFTLAVADVARAAAPAARRIARAVRSVSGRSAEEWFDSGCELEEPAPADAIDCYERALELDPTLSDAHVNLGRLRHDRDELAAAEAHYRAALELDPADATAAFNLGVVLEDRGRAVQALDAYERAIAAAELAPDRETHREALCDAHYNASGVCERLGRHPDALRHLKRYRELGGGGRA